MATFREDRDMAREILTLALHSDDDRRSGPPHVSQLVQCLRKSWNQRRGTSHAALTEKEMATFLTGKGHHALIQALPLHADYQIEVPFVDKSIPMQGTKDGVLYIQSQGVRRVVEIKSTRSSSNKTPDDLAHYVEQLAAYCLNENTPYGTLIVLHLLGDWKDHKPSQLKVWHITFDEKDLELWSRELRRRASILLSDVEPAIGEHQTWECGYCPFSVTKGGRCAGGRGRDYGFFALYEGRDADYTSVGES